MESMIVIDTGNFSMIEELFRYMNRITKQETREDARFLLRHARQLVGWLRRDGCRMWHLYHAEVESMAWVYGL